MRVFQNFQKRKLLFVFILIIVTTYFFTNAIGDKSTFLYQNESSILLGLSIIEQEPSSILGTFLDGNNANNTETKNITSSLLQSSNPSAQIFLDYIYIPNNSISIDRICFQEIVTTKNNNIPTQLLFGSNGLSDLKIGSNSYIYEFQDNRCANKGENHIAPHILLGIVPVDSYAMFGLVKGYRSSQFFPLDEQKIELDITVMSDEFEPFSPSLQVVVAHKGWNGTIRYDNPKKPILHLTRSGVYKWIFGAFFLIMAIIIRSLNDIVDELGSFFEITFGLLLGLWGMHEILVPAYIVSSILIDITIYILYILVMIVILETLILGAQKRKVKITDIDRQDHDSEHVIIENPSYFSIDITGWLLRDRAGNKYKFPKFTLPRKKLFTRENYKLKVWTKKGEDTNTDLYWGKSEPIWIGFQVTAYLEDTKGEIISARNDNQ
jgi:hypothetical protein